MNEKKMPAAGRQGKKKRQKRRISRFHMAVILFVAILAVTGALVFLLLSMPKADGEAAAKPAVFGVKAVMVEGETRYDREAIAGLSGIRVGQSLLTVNKLRAIENIKKNFPYIRDVSVGNASFDTICITVREAEPIGAVYSAGQWLVVDDTGKALEALPIEGDRPPRYLYFKGAELQGSHPGEIVMAQRDVDIVNTLINAFDQYRLDDVTEIDLSEKADIRLDWKNQITLLMGGDSNLDREVKVAATILPELMKNRGNNVTGVLDMRAYANPEVGDPQAIYHAGTVPPYTAATTGPVTTAGTTVP